MMKGDIHIFIMLISALRLFVSRSRANKAVDIKVPKFSILKDGMALHVLRVRQRVMLDTANRLLAMGSGGLVGLVLGLHLTTQYESAERNSCLRYLKISRLMR